MIQPVIITPGDPAGIGPEISLRAWSKGQRHIVLIEEISHLQNVANRAGLDIDFIPYKSPDHFHSPLPTEKCVVIEQEWLAPPLAGRPDMANAKATIAAIKQAVDLVKEGQFSALVTNPIAKSVLYEAGFAHPGHTEYLASLDGRDVRPVMMLANEHLKVVPLTIHIPISKVEESIKEDDIGTILTIMATDLGRYFGIKNPKIAVTGLNPHAGEGGHIGRFETDKLSPILSKFHPQTGAVYGPFSADSLFHEAARGAYDAILCMYHDQALIPVKTLDFFHTVNITLGLSFIRTSPDHGTAFDRAANFNSHPDSLIAAIEMAQKMANQTAQSTL